MEINKVHSLSAKSVRQPGVIKVTRYDSPFGQMLVGTVGKAVCLCEWSDSYKSTRIYYSVSRRLGARYIESGSPTARLLMNELDEYFAGLRTEFTLPLMMAGTPFQCRVWEKLVEIPFGETISYAGLARRVGNPGAFRAVAQIVGANPISILVPCHRVIGSDGRLTGYAGGLEIKRRLLDLEARGS